MVECHSARGVGWGIGRDLTSNSAILERKEEKKWGGRKARRKEGRDLQHWQEKEMSVPVRGWGCLSDPNLQPQFGPRGSVIPESLTAELPPIFPFHSFPPQLFQNSSFYPDSSR